MERRLFSMNSNIYLALFILKKNTDLNGPNVGM